MSVISGTDYKKLADKYAVARTNVIGSAEYLFDAVYDVVMLQSLQPEVDLLSEFYNSYLVNANLWKAPSSLLSAVKTLNNHVIRRGNYASLNDYFAAEVIIDPTFTVPVAWAELCEIAGFTIDPIYIA
jgi:hypothetical protein